MESLPDPGAGGRGLEGLKSGLLIFQGNYDQALETLLERYDKDIETGSLQDLYSTSWLIVIISLFTGDSIRGKKAAEEMIELAKGGVWSKSVPYSYLSRVYSQAGEIQEAAKQLEEAKLEAEVTQSEYLDQIHYMWAQADLDVAEENWESAWSDYGDLIDLLATKKLRWFRTLTLVDLAEAHLARGEAEDREKAIQFLKESLEEFKDMGAGGFVKKVEDQLSDL